MKWEIVDDYEALSARAAAILLEAVRTTPRIALGLPTGATPLGMYRKLREECARSYHCFSFATTFNLDEYVGVKPNDPASYATYMRKHLFDHVDVDPVRVNIPRGAPDDEGIAFDSALAAECLRYEEAIRAAGGLGITFLGMGRNGHIGFNEPGSALDSPTRVVSLSPSTRDANAPYFPGREVPARAITMGIGTILSSRRLVLLAAGEAKAEGVRILASERIDPMFPASALHRHDDALVIVDRPAAALIG
jgi:glucosamine-6-phosphate deaminase